MPDRNGKRENSKRGNAKTPKDGSKWQRSTRPPRNGSGGMPIDKGTDGSAQRKDKNGSKKDD